MLLPGTPDDNGNTFAVPSPSPFSIHAVLPIRLTPENNQSLDPGLSRANDAAKQLIRLRKARRCNLLRKR